MTITAHVAIQCRPNTDADSRPGDFLYTGDIKNNPKLHTPVFPHLGLLFEHLRVEGWVPAPNGLDYTHDFDEDEALAEGWGIVRDPDEPTKLILACLVFNGDEDVWRHVATQAKAGSKLHIAALKLIDRDELAKIRKLFP